MRLGRPAKRRKNGVKFRMLHPAPSNALEGAGVLQGSFGETVNCTRNSVGSSVDRNGLVRVHTANLPRVQPAGVLIEPERRNDCLRSQSIAASPWVGVNVTVAVPTATDNTTDVTAPDGTSTATKLVFPDVLNAGEASVWNQNIGSTVGQKYSFSVWLRTLTGTATVYLEMRDSTNSGQACAVTSTWQRFKFENRTSALSTINADIGVNMFTSGTVGQPAQTIYAWGAQLEIGTYASSYIPTTNNPVTRAIDLFDTSSAKWPTAAGELQFDYTPLESGAVAAHRYILDTRDGITNSGIVIIRHSDGKLFVRTGEAVLTTDAVSSVLTWTAGTMYRICVSWNSALLALYRDGVLVASAATPNVPDAHANPATFSTASNNVCEGFITNFSIRSI